MGRAISWMFRRDLRSVTRSAAWRSVRPDMSSTSLCSAGSEEVVVAVGEIGDGGGGDDDGVEVVASAVAVASARVKGLRAAEAHCERVAARRRRARGRRLCIGVC